MSEVSYQQTHSQQVRDTSPEKPAKKRKLDTSDVSTTLPSNKERDNHSEPPKKSKEKESIEINDTLKCILLKNKVRTLESKKVELETNNKELIKQLFLFEMPPDFFSFWEMCETMNKNDPTNALKAIKLKLVGPFDVLAGKVSEVYEEDLPDFLKHWRYYYDPPEFQTVICNENSSCYHMGYFRDDPKEMPVFVASNVLNPKDPEKNGELKIRGQNLFAALNYKVEKCLKYSQFYFAEVPYTQLLKYKENVENQVLYKQSNHCQIHHHHYLRLGLGQGFPYCGTRTPWWYARRCQGVREQNHASFYYVPADAREISGCGKSEGSFILRECGYITDALHRVVSLSVFLSFANDMDKWLPKSSNVKKKQSVSSSLEEGNFTPVPSTSSSKDLSSSVCSAKPLELKTDPFSRMKIPQLQKTVTSWAKEKGFSLEKTSKAMEARSKKVVASTFHKAGIVVPVDKKNDVGYRELAASNSMIKKMLKGLVDSKSEEERAKYWEQLQPVITFANIANDECDFGTSLELGQDLFTYGSPLLHRSAKQLLTTAYTLLGRNEFATIIEVHLDDRRKGGNLSIL
ncbi:hypothetical protein J6590_085796 [Homalodisca vitripennis]|nr:hypothetical protein J6590_085796 [Homalodisca vitripennis]